MKQKLLLQQKLLQKLSPQQIQVIKLLEIPTLQLEQRIKKELEENPVLELESEGQEPEEDNETRDDAEPDADVDKDEFTFDDYYDEEEDIPSYKLNVNNYSKDEVYVDIPFSIGTSFHEFLYEQLGMVKFTEEQQQLAEYIIGNIDDDGYLRRDLVAISDDLAFNMNIEISEDELLNILKVIQEFDPPGVGARDLRECLLIQLNKKKGDEQHTSFKILSDFFDEFTKKHYSKIQTKLELSDKELKDAIDHILKLNPKPGSSYSNPLNKSNQHIVPDFMLESIDGELILSLNQRNVPDLKINETYLGMLRALGQNHKDKSKKEALQFVKEKLDSAKWFIDALQQRQTTLLLTMSEIINFQHEYFQDGDETKLRPMILKDIAERTELDISTISRVSNSKYIQTHFGIYPLKYFFSEGLQKDDGEEVSTREIKKILQDCIENEDKLKPLTDDKLALILKKKTYNIARRTVAKYREQLGIPVARLRKEL
jgi:RNA polymerase sigma-54 factor